MPVMTDVLVTAAVGKSAGRFSGKQHEYAPYNCMLTLLATSSLADTSVTLNIGGEVVVDDMLISAANRFPVSPDDVVCRAPILKGQRIIYDIRNATAVTTIRSMVILDPA